MREKSELPEIEAEFNFHGSYIYRIVVSVTINAIHRAKARREERLRLAEDNEDEDASEEQFVRAVTGEMGQQERAQMAKHLVACSDCVEEYRILRSLRPLAEQAEAILAASTAPIVSRRPEKRGQCDVAGPGSVGPPAASRMQDRI